MTASDTINAAKVIDTRLRQLAEHIMRLDNRHDNDTDNMSYEWRLDDSEITITVKTRWMANDSCHCHPEYSIHDHQTAFTFPAADVEKNLPANAEAWDDFSVESITGVPELAARFKAERQAAAEEKERKRREEAEQERNRQEERERDELRRLQAKYS